MQPLYVSSAHNLLGVSFGDTETKFRSRIVCREKLRPQMEFLGGNEAGGLIYSSQWLW